jgi:hypothetical protein
MNLDDLRDLRDSIADELPMHASSPAHPRHCLCGNWDGEGSYYDHLADVVIGMLPGSGVLS